MSLRRVDLPEPFKPTNAVFSPVLIRHETPSRIFLDPKYFLTPSSSIMDKRHHLRECEYEAPAPKRGNRNRYYAFEEKLLALKTRGEPRDYFDVWFICQKLNKKVKIPKPKIHPRKFKGEIAQLLPNNWKKWPAEFLKSNERD